MADSQKILEILVENKVIGQDQIKAAEQSLQEVRQTVTKTGEATGVLKEAEKAGEEQAEKFGISHREAGHILKELGEQAIPGAGRALSELRLGLLGVGLAVGEVFGKMREEIAKTNADLDAMSEKAEEAFNNVKTNLFDAIRHEEFSTDKIDAFFKHIEEQARHAHDAIESALNIAHEMESATEKVLRANEKNELARIAADPTLTDQQKKGASQAVKDKYAALIGQQEGKGQQDEVDAAKAERDIKQGELNKLLTQQHGGQPTPERIAAIDKTIESLPENNALRRQYDQAKADGGVVYSQIETEAVQKNVDTELASLQSKLGLDEQTGKMADGGDAKRAKDLRSQIENSQAYKDATFTLSTINRNLASPNLSDTQRKNFESQKGFQERLISGITGPADQADAAVKADQDRIEQLKNNAAELAQAAAKEKELNTKIEELKREVDAATQKLKEVTTIAGIRNDATEKTIATDAQTAAITAAAQRIAGKDPNAILGAGAGADDDLRAMAKEGFTLAKIGADYQKAITDQKTPGAFTPDDQAAMDRYKRLVADQNAIAELKALLTSLGNNQMAILQIMWNHQRVSSTHEVEIKALQNAYGSLLATTQTHEAQIGAANQSQY